MTQKIEFKVGIFIIISTLLIIASIGYVAYKKDVFSKFYTYTLSSKTGENITEGMPVVFWGFNIGKVSSMELTDQAVLVRIKIPERNNKVIRADSRFVLDKPLLGASRIIVSTNDLNGPPLSEKIVPEIIISNDINESIKRVQTIAEKLDKIAGNLTTITENLADPHGDLTSILKNAETVTALFAKKNSLMDMVVGNPDGAKSIQDILNNAQDIMVRVDGVVKKIDALAGKTDEQINGQDGVFTLVRNILNDLLAKLAKIDGTLDNLNKTSSETVDATKDLNALRKDLDEMVMSITILVDELDRMIPLKAEPEIKLP